MDKQICMSFKFTDEFSNVEYQETVQTKTDACMVNLIIGSGLQTGGYASSFSDISWSTLNKKLAVGINTNGSCTTFIEISNQDFRLFLSLTQPQMLKMLQEWFQLKMEEQMLLQ
jgi:hypothetical protein